MALLQNQQQNNQQFKNILKFTEQVKLNKNKPSIVMPILDAENLSQELTSLLALLVVLQSDSEPSKTVTVELKGNTF